MTEVEVLSGAVLRRHARTFWLASWFLPRSRRSDAAVVYAFCRLVDDLADEADSPQAAGQALTQVLDELNGRKPARPLVAAYRSIVEQAGIGLAPARNLIAGVLSDLDAVRIASDAALLRYSYQVAGTVGLMMCGVLGVRDEAAFPHAVDLGIAMQLTNICRDVLEDAGLGRVYLPADRLQAVGVSHQAVLSGQAPSQAVAQVVRDLLCMAEAYYQSGRAGLRYIPLRSRVAIAVAAQVYRAIGRVLLARGADALAGRVVVGPGRKLFEVTWALCGLWPARVPHRAELHKDLVGLPGT